VLAEYLLESPALIDSITAKVTAQAQLTAKQKAARLKKLDTRSARPGASSTRRRRPRRFAKSSDSPRPHDSGSLEEART